MISMIQYSDITSLIHQALSASLSPVATQITEIILSALLAFIVMIVCVIIMVYMERKVAGFMQMRLGPNRVGPFGTFQVFYRHTEFNVGNGVSVNGTAEISGRGGHGPVVHWRSSVYSVTWIDFLV